MATANYNIDLTGEWEFHLGELKIKKELGTDDYHIIAEAGGALHKYDTEAAKWTKVTLPHDWLSHLPYDKKASAMNGYKRREVAWYRKKFTTDGSEIESATLIFEGILGDSEVFVNGISAKRNFSGYNNFSVEIGEYLLAGEQNEIVVRVDGSHIEGWFYEGAGIYRPCRIELRERTRFSKENCFIRTEIKEGTPHLLADIAVVNPDCASVKITLLDATGGTVAEYEVAAEELISFDKIINGAKLWSIKNPYLYTLICKLKCANKPIDSFECEVGFRSLALVKDKGLYLNSERIMINGICSHQDHAGVGAALTAELIEYRINKLKALGINAYRTSHNAPSEELLRICDRLGMLVMVENRNFSLSDSAVTELKALIKLSRNHPSVVFYSLFNEEPWQADLRGYRIAKKMREVILSLDNTRFVTAAQNAGVLARVNAADSLDIIGMNYKLSEYEACHQRQPDKLILGTENCPTFATRGIYKTDRKKRVFSSYGDDYADWFSESIDQTMSVRKYPYVIGCFIWCGFEHKGEPVPYDWPSVYSHWGMCDSCGFEKDTAYLLRAYYSDKLSVHLLPHWNNKSGETVDVRAFTNAEEAELFLNGRSLGKRRVELCRASWQVCFEPGELTVRVKRGEEEKSYTVSTHGKAHKIVIEDCTPRRSNPTSRIVNLKIVDETGTLVSNFNKKLSFSLEGGKILGVGNGDPNSHHDEKASSIRAFFGRAQVILSADTKALTVRCKNMVSEEIFYE